MKHPRLFVKALAPALSAFLLLAGITLLRARVWAAGAGCLFFALAGLAWSVRLLERTPFTTEEMDVLRPRLPSLILWTVIASLTFISVLYVADDTKSAETDQIASLAFLLSLFLGLAAVWWDSLQSAGRVLTGRVKTNRRDIGILALVLLGTFLLRTLDLPDHPYPWSGDEASIGIEARRILDGEVTNFFDTGWSSQPNWSFVPTAVTQALFGYGIFAVRLASAIAGMLAVLFVVLAGREMFNPAVGLMAGAFLATMPYHLHFSRIGVSNIVDSVISSAMFWLIARSIDKDDPRYYYSAGAVAGLSIYTYAGTRLVLILAFLTFLFLILRQRDYLSAHWRHLIAFAGGTAVSAAPQAAFFARHPDIFIGRLGQEGLFLNDWLAGQIAVTGKDALEILFEQFTRTTLVFIASAAPGNFFNSPQPYLTLLGSILFLAGMAYAFAYISKPPTFIVILWFWTVVLFGGILTLNPPANTRLLMSTPAVAILLGLGAFKILEYLQRFNIVAARLFAPLLLVLASVLAYQNIRFYMYDYRANYYFENANGEFAMEAGQRVAALGKDVQVYILGEPRLYAEFPTFQFIAPDHPRTNLGAAGLETFELSPGQKAAFFAIPENRASIAEIARKYPGGERGLVFRRPRPDEVLFEYYIVSR
jgi:4-amino-4-deoxy-L-arabinose transferase-like glycosyltransferase